MKKAAISLKKPPAKVPLKVIHEHEVVYFEDETHSKMVAITVRLPSATLFNEVNMSLVMKGTSQYLCIKTPMKQRFFDHDMAQANLANIIGDSGRRWENFLHEKEKGLVELRKKHGKWNAEQEEDAEEGQQEPIMSMMEVKLQFICYDIGDKWAKKEKDAGTFFQRHDIFGETKKLKHKEHLTVLTIVLAKKEKEKPVNRQTPQKATNYAMDTFEPDDDDEEFADPS